MGMGAAPPAPNKITAPRRVLPLNKKTSPWQILLDFDIPEFLPTRLTAPLVENLCE